MVKQETDMAYRYRRFEDDLPYDERESVVQKVLGAILALLVLILVLGTVFALTVGKKKVGSEYRQVDPTPQQVVNMSARKGGKLSTYNSLGQLRPLTKAEGAGKDGAVLVVSPWFTYPEGDTPLFEEISQKDRLIKNVITEYFAGRTKSELLAMGEKNVKAELLNLVNDQLVLGKISAIYFDQYIFLQ